MQTNLGTLFQHPTQQGVWIIQDRLTELAITINPIDPESAIFLQQSSIEGTMVSYLTDEFWMASSVAIAKQSK